MTSSGLRAPTAAPEMWKRYSDYLRKAPELVVRWRDRETPATGYLVINSLRGGACGGGTRMRPGVTSSEVNYLAKAMELKFALTGPPIGGAKSGIDFDPSDPRKPEVLERWYRAIRPYLQHCYGTGGDLGVDEMEDVLPCFGRIGLRHPQEGVVRGHLRLTDGRFDDVIRMIDDGVKAPVATGVAAPGLPFTISDLITGYGVARTVEKFLAARGSGAEGARVLLEGFGNVGASCALFLARSGARIVGISDAEKVLIDPAGVDAGGIENLIRRGRRKLIPDDDPRVHRGEARGRFWETPADVFVAAALSGTIDAERLNQLDELGVHVLACGANQPFREASMGATDIQREADRRFSVLPDILANCGMARTFSFLMESTADSSPHRIFDAVDRTVEDTLVQVLDRAGDEDRDLLAATLGLSLDRIAAAE